MTVMLQASLIDDRTDQPTLGALGPTVQRTVLTRGAWLDLRRGWLSAPSAVFDRLAGQVPWQAERREMYEREVDVPRLLAFYAEGAELPCPVLTQARDALSRYYATELGEPFRTAATAWPGTATRSAAAAPRTPWSPSCRSGRRALCCCVRAAVARR